MSPEMAFQCFLVSRDPAVVSTLDPILRDLSICTDVCRDASKMLEILRQVTTDLLVVDLEDESSVKLLNGVSDSSMWHKPTILAVSATDGAIPGVHVVLHKPVTSESGVRSLTTAYSRMLHNFRKQTRFAMMTSVLATDENNRSLPLIVTNVGAGGVGLATKEKLEAGTVLSFQMSLPGLETHVHIQARVLWTRGDGAAGCEFVRVSGFDLQLLHAWLDSHYRIKKPLIPVV